jgi:hypothetical protein
MSVRSENLNKLSDERIIQINRLMSDLNTYSDNLYENLADKESRLSLLYLNKIIELCEATKTKLDKYLL